MIIMQGGDLNFWFWMEALFAVLFTVGTWYFVVIGRDRKPWKQTRGEETIVRYGDLEEDRAPLPKFLIFTYIGVGVWAVGYLFWTGFKGIGF